VSWRSVLLVEEIVVPRENNVNPHFLSTFDVKLKTRWAIIGSWEPLVCNLQRRAQTNVVLVIGLYELLLCSHLDQRGGTTRHNFGRGPSNGYFIKVWFKLAQWLQRSWLKCEKLTDGRTDGRQTCPVIPTSNQDGHQAKNRKKGDEILIVHCCFSISQNELKF
jgi:hypothetical protein